MNRAELQKALRKQSVFVQENDPVLDVGAIFEASLAEASHTLNEAVKVNIEQIRTAHKEGLELSRKQAEMGLRQAVDWVQTQMRETGRTVTEAMLAEVRQERERIEKASKVALWSAYVAGFVAFCGVLYLVTSLLAEYHII